MYILCNIKKREQILCYADRYRQTPRPITSMPTHIVSIYLLLVGSLIKLAILSAPKQNL